LWEILEFVALTTNSVTDVSQDGVLLTAEHVIQPT